LKVGPVADAYCGAFQTFLAGPKKLAQRLDSIEQALPAIGSDDKVGLVRKQQVPVLADSAIGSQTIFRKEVAHSVIRETSEYDRAIFCLCFGFHPQNVKLQSRLVLDFFGKGLGGDAVFGLMAELDENLCARAYPEPAVAHLIFFGLRLEL
jgi:hypothetical protein